MKTKVFLVSEAEQDVLDMYLYAARNDSIDKAEHLLENLEKTINKLQTMPLRGHRPPELEHIGVYDFREIFYKPYRIIYQIINRCAYVHCVLDGRRDLQSLLQQRLLRSDI